MSFFNTIRQNVVVSTVNSSTANLASLATFTGTAESTLTIGAIQVNYFSTQDSTIQIQQSSDGVNWDIVDSFITLANTGDSRITLAVAAFFRVLITNNGAIATTSLRLQTLLAPIESVLPRALTQSGNLKVSIENTGDIPTYAATAIGLVTAASATDIFTITGSATKIIKVHKITITATRTTSTTTDIQLVKRSTANSGGTSTNPTRVPNDSLNPSATATINAYTANPTTGTLVGSFRAEKEFINVAGTGPSDRIGWLTDVLAIQPWVLRGINEVMAVNLNGVTITGPSFDIYIVWTEED